jgi:pyrroloquinoline-quinone synthase
MQLRRLRGCRNSSQAKSLLRHPFFNALQDPAKGPIATKIWATQDYYVAREFPRILGALVAVIDDPRVRHPLVMNLWEEHGEGAIHGSHALLFERLMKSLDMDVGNLTAILPATRYFIDSQVELSWKDVLTGLGAFCYGNEYLTIREFLYLQSACVHHFPQADLAYFSANREADGRHTREAESVIFALCEDDSGIARVEAGATLAVTLRGAFYDSLLAELP